MSKEVTNDELAQRPRGAVVVIVLWMVGWGLGFGGLAELIVDPHGKTLDIWPAEMAIPGFIGGMVFAGLLLVGERHRHLGEVTLARCTVWGVVTGVVLGALSTATGGTIPLSLAAAEMIGLATALSAAAAIGSAVFVRLLARGHRPAAAGRMS